MKKDNLPVVEIAKLSEAVGNDHKFTEDLALIEIGYKSSILYPCKEQQIPIRLKGLTLVLVTHGCLRLSVDYVDYEVRSNSLLVITADRIVQFNKKSSDMRGVCIVISKAFLDMMNPMRTPPSMLRYLFVKNNPCLSLNKSELSLLEQACRTVRNKLYLSGHNYHKEVVQVALFSLLLEVGNVLQNKQCDVQTTQLSRKEELMEQFLHLLFEYVKEKHLVTFYAGKLFITPQYLSSVLNELSGKSANKWIDEALIAEAKLLLKTPQVTVQEVADMLHFSDQSTFGKFFKKHVGLSPTEYRKS